MSRTKSDGRARRVRVEGVGLSPVAGHRGWDDDRLCHNGLLGHDFSAGRWAVHAPLARQMAELGGPP